MEVALRRRLEGVAEISISQREQTAEVRFAPGGRLFSPDAFRKAVGEAGVRVRSFHVDVCGSVEENRQERWLVAGKNRWRLTGGPAVPTTQPVCVSGRLDDHVQPMTLEIAQIRTASNF
jgi:hypothetical protein